MYDRKTRNNHFVPQFYLKKFCDGQKLYVLNKKTGRIQEKNTTKTVASKKDLYTLRKKIDKNDIEFCTNIFPPQLITDLDKATLKLLTLFLNDELGKIINMRSLVELLGGNNEVQEYMEKKWEEAMINQSDSMQQEALMGLYETGFLSVLEKILSADKMDFLDQTKKDFPGVKIYLYKKINSFIIKAMQEISAKHVFDRPSKLEKMFSPMENDFINLVHYMNVQFSRTAKKYNDIFEKEEIKENLENLHVDPKNVMALILNYKLIDITSNLCEKGFHVVLIKNGTRTDFIASDNPVVNIHSGWKMTNEMTAKDFELYMPVTPKRGLLLTNNPVYNQTVEFFLHEEDIHHWNHAVIKNSEQDLYSGSRETLEQLRKKYNWEQTGHTGKTLLDPSLSC